MTSRISSIFMICILALVFKAGAYTITIPTLCVGATAPLSTTVPGGGGTWQSTGHFTSINTTTGVVTGLSQGKDTITYTQHDTVVTNTLLVSPLPAGIAGPSVLCTGSVGLMTDATTGGTWASSNSIVAIGSAGGDITAGSSAGTAIITYQRTNASHCYVTYTVTVRTTTSGTISATPSLQVCRGGSITLTASPTGGTWSLCDATRGTIDGSTGSFNATSVVADLGFTTYETIQYISSTACFHNVVTINPLPAVSTGDAIVCTGATTTWSNSAPGGTWSSSDMGGATVGSATGIVTGVSSAGAYITYTLPTGCYLFKRVTVNPTPAAITGTAQMCVGHWTPLSDETYGGTWSSGNIAIATVGSSTGAVTGVSPGTAIITYSNSSGCFSIEIVTVHPFATVSGTLSVCVGSTTTLGSDITGGTWVSESEDYLAIDLTTGVATGVDATPIISVYYTSPAGCLTTVFATVNPLADVYVDGTLCEGSTLNVVPSLPLSSVSSSNTSVATIGTPGYYFPVTGVAAGTTTLTVTTTHGCISTYIATVEAAPAAITGDLAMCVDLPATLTNGVSGGTWSNTWGSIYVGSASGRVSTSNDSISEGSSDIIIYTLANGCYVEALATVNAIPWVYPTSSYEICAGQTMPMTDAVSGGTWSSANSTIATVGSTGIVTGIAAGTVAISYTAPTGCIGKTIMTVDPVAVITAGLSVCTLSTSQLEADIPGGDWYDSDDPIILTTIFGVMTSYYGAGTTTISYILPTGCMTTATATASVLPAITGTTSICTGSTSLLSNSSAGGTWTSGNTSIATVGSAGLVTGVAAGTTEISYTLGCTRKATVTISNCGGKPGDDNGLSALDDGQSYALSPNPGDGNITIRQSVADDAILNVKVLNYAGAVIHNGTIEFKDGSSHLQIGSTVAGMYLVVLTNKAGVTSTLRVVVQ